MANSAFMVSEIVGHGAYVCLRRASGADVEAAARAPIETLAARLGLRNEFDPGETPPADSIAFLRRRTTATARRVFLASILYLPILLCLMVLDR